MLTTGGGWQDQAGGILHGIKLVETQPGLVQRPMARWLPEDLFTAPDTKRCLLLYYTGITRVAKGILQEIVRGMFLNSTQHLAIVDEIAAHAHTTFDVIQRADWDGLCRAVDTSWYLNRILDSGTCPPAVEALLAEVEDWLAAGKLLGAGGGGYMLMLAKDTDAAARIREKLTREPPNSKARFVDLDVSRTGLQVTRS
jgi:galactokinase/mevalonate kinase-like predicted kinase